MGGAEPTLYRGSVWYTPIVEEWYYQVEVLKLEVGDQNLDLDCREVNVKLCIQRWSLKDMFKFEAEKQYLLETVNIHS